MTIFRESCFLFSTICWFWINLKFPVLKQILFWPWPLPKTTRLREPLEDSSRQDNSLGVPSQRHWNEAPKSGTVEPLNVRKNDRKFRSTKAADVFFCIFLFFFGGMLLFGSVVRLKFKSTWSICCDIFSYCDTCPKHDDSLPLYLTSYRWCMQMLFVYWRYSQYLTSHVFDPNQRQPISLYGESADDCNSTIFMV